jgi:hypothetical protein
LNLIILLIGIIPLIVFIQVIESIQALNILILKIEDRRKIEDMHIFYPLDWHLSPD